MTKLTDELVLMTELRTESKTGPKLKTELDLITARLKTELNSTMNLTDDERALETMNLKMKLGIGEPET